MIDTNETMNFNIEGHIKIINLDDNSVIVNKRNAINYQNFAKIISTVLANSGNNGIHSMAFGNGGVNVDSLGVITYKPTKTAGTSGSLYNENYSKIVQNDPQTDAENNLSFVYVDGNNYSDVVITATLDYDEPANYPETDTTNNINDDYVFNEIGLKTLNDEYLTHIIFHPVLKSQNRKIQVIYTIRLTIGA
jgi:hypothetical protein